MCRTSITDLSDLKQAEQKLQKSERLFASFMVHLPSVAVIRDLEGRYLFANAAWEQAFQKYREAVAGQNHLKNSGRPKLPQNSRSRTG